MDKAIQDLAAKWLEYDQNPSTKADIQSLLDSNDQTQLSRRLEPRIAFGTAGLRARMEAGFTRMNDLTVIQASNGLAEYLLSQIPDAKSRGVVVGRDARHNSERFARLTAAAFVSKGIKVWWLEDLAHTPLVPFSVKTYGAAAGVMITASHNPPQDNGYKVYWGNACQIIPPHDAGIAKAINDNLWSAHCWDTTLVDKPSNLVQHILEDALKKYLESLQRLVGPEQQQPDPQFVHTSLHGVGNRFIHEAVKACSASSSSTSIIPVREQADPNPDFPTVKFPNPEEAGALDLAIKTADAHDCPLILANDPDADRFCAAERQPDGRWHQFTGNELGILLASHLLSQPAYAANRHHLVLLNTTVSTRMLAALARAHGCTSVETLTGFKWLGNVAQQQTQAGFQAPYAFEEALGFMFADVVHDKDGVAAAVVFLAAVARWRSAGRSLLQQWQALCAAHGFFVDANTYLVTPQPSVTGTAFADLRSRIAAEGRQYPQTVGGRTVTWWRDLTVGYDSGTADGRPTLPVDAGSQMVSGEVVGAAGLATRFTVRGSGTEPKIKLYVESTAGSEDEARKEATEVQRAIVAEWFDLDKYGLRMPG